VLKMTYSSPLRFPYKSIFNSMKEKGKLLVSICWSVLLYLIFVLISALLIDIEGLSLITYVFMGFVYILTIGRHSIFSDHRLFSQATAPCFLPAFLFCLSRLPGFISSDLLGIVEIVIWVALSRWSLFVEPSKNSATYWSPIRKILFFTALQGVYGLGLQFTCPSLLEPLEWQITGKDLKPNNRFSSSTGIQFFYEDLREA